MVCGRLFEAKWNCGGPGITGRFQKDPESVGVGGVSNRAGEFDEHSSALRKSMGDDPSRPVREICESGNSGSGQGDTGDKGTGNDCGASRRWSKRNGGTSSPIRGQATDRIQFRRDKSYGDDPAER